MRNGTRYAAAVFFASIAFPVSGAGTGYVFVSHEQSNTVVVLDPANDHEIVAEIETSRRPRDMQFDSDHKLLYVACGDDDVIDVIDVASLEVVDHVQTGISPEVFTLTHNDKTLFVSEEEHAVVRHIEIATGETLAEIPTGPEPEGVWLTDDGQTLFVTSEIADLVHVVDLAQGRVVENILVGTRPRRFAMNADHTELWVSDELSGQASIIDPESYEIIDIIEFLPPGFRSVDVTPVGLALSSDGETMYVGLGRANHVAFVDTVTHEVEDYILAGSRSWGVAESAEHELLYVTNGLSDDLTIIDLTAGQAARSIATGLVPHSVVVDE